MGGGTKTLPPGQSRLPTLSEVAKQRATAKAKADADVNTANAVAAARASLPAIASPGAQVAAATTAAARERRRVTGSGRSGTTYTPAPSTPAIPTVGKTLPIPTPGKLRTY
jgi:hypothetical protein